MLTFFRRIRKGLLGTGTTGKYLLYAIGEIALVVIGILIALQINNWNEWRKDRVMESLLLQDIAENLESNLVQLDNSINRAIRWNNSRDIVLNSLQNKLSCVDTLSRHFNLANNRSFAITTIVRTSFEMLKNEGFGILESETVKKELVNLFEITYSDLQRNEQESSFEVLEEEMTKFTRREFSLIEGGGARIPVNYQHLLEDNFYIETLKTIKGWSESLNEKRTEAISETQRVLQLIKDELGE